MDIFLIVLLIVVSFSFELHYLFLLLFLFNLILFSIILILLIVLLRVVSFSIVLHSLFILLLNWILYSIVISWLVTTSSILFIHSFKKYYLICMASATYLLFLRLKLFLIYSNYIFHFNMLQRYLGKFNQNEI